MPLQLPRRGFLAGAAAVGATALTLAPNAMALTPWNQDLGGIASTQDAAIGGYDPVAYFVQGGPAEGNPAFSAPYDGGTFFFASAANRDRFVANPQAYAPQFGGYCAYAMARNYVAKIHPNAWTIRDDKLYLNFDRSVRALWLTRVEREITNGEANWPGIKAQLLA